MIEEKTISRAGKTILINVSTLSCFFMSLARLNFRRDRVRWRILKIRSPQKQRHLVSQRALGLIQVCGGSCCKGRVVSARAKGTDLIH